MQYSNWTSQQRTLALQTANSKPEDCTVIFDLDVTLKELETLANCNVLSLKNHAKQIIMDRVMSEKNLAYLLECAQSIDPTTRKRAFIVFNQLADQERNCHILVKKKALKILAKSLKTDQDTQTHKFAVATLFKLVAENDKRKVKLCGYNVCESLCAHLQANPGRYSELKYWVILLLHQLTITDALTSYIVENKVLYILVDTLRLTYGNVPLQKLCLHSMVRTLATLTDDFGKKTLQLLAEMKLIPLAAACLRNGDTELSQWSVFLIHEFVSRKVKIEDIIKIKGLVKICTSFVKPDDAIIPRIVLRCFKNLCDADKDFYKELLKNNVLSLLLKTVEQYDEQTQYWGVALLHVLLYHMGSHKEFFQLKGMETLAKLTKSKPVHTNIYVAEMIIVLVSDPANMSSLERASPIIMKMLLKFISADDYDLKHSAITALVNLLAISKIMTSEFQKHDGFSILCKMFLSRETSDGLKSEICKSISSMTQQDPELLIQVLVQAIIPGYNLLFSYITKAVKTISSESPPLSSLSPTFKPPFTPINAEFPELPEFSTVASEIYIKNNTLLDCLDILMTDLMINTICNDDTYLQFLSDIFEDIAAALMNTLILPLYETSSFETGVDLMIFKEDVAAKGLKCLLGLLDFSPIKDFLESGFVFQILLQLLHCKSQDLLETVVIAFTVMLQSGSDIIYKGYNKRELLNNHESVAKLLQTCVNLKRDHIWCYFNEFMFLLCDFTSVEKESSYLHLSKLKSTASVDLFKSSQYVRNRFWTFETVLGSHGVAKSGKFAFEFQVLTDSIMQIGWSAESAWNSPFGGWGVGDNLDSYAYDGFRTRKWHGRDVDQDTYGSRWRSNDIVTSMIDLDEGTISFLLNGKDMGIAFKNVDKSKTWYPAASLTLDQCGKFKFGKVLDALVFCPETHSPIPDGSMDVQSHINLADFGLEWKETPVTLTFYYEIQIGISGADQSLCLAAGCVSSTETVTTLAYSFKKQCVFIVQASLSSIFDHNLAKIVTDGNSSAQPPLNIVESIPFSFYEGLRIGIGADSNQNFVLTVCGKSVQLNCALDGKSFLPYLRNIPKYYLNMGQYDFEFQTANLSYSPTKFLF